VTLLVSEILKEQVPQVDPQEVHWPLRTLCPKGHEETHTGFAGEEVEVRNWPVGQLFGSQEILFVAKTNEDAHWRQTKTPLVSYPHV